MSKKVNMLVEKTGRYCIYGEDADETCNGIKIAPCCHYAYVKAGEVISTSSRNAEDYRNNGLAVDTDSTPTVLWSEEYESGLSEDEIETADHDELNRMRISAGLPTVKRESDITLEDKLRAAAGVCDINPKYLADTPEQAALAKAATENENMAKKRAYDC